MLWYLFPGYLYSRVGEPLVYPVSMLRSTSNSSLQISKHKVQQVHTDIWEFYYSFTGCHNTTLLHRLRCQPDGFIHQVRWSLKWLQFTRSVTSIQQLLMSFKLTVSSGEHWSHQDSSCQNNECHTLVRWAWTKVSSGAHVNIFICGGSSLNSWSSWMSLKIELSYSIQA